MFATLVAGELATWLMDEETSCRLKLCGSFYIVNPNSSKEEKEQENWVKCQNFSGTNDEYLSIFFLLIRSDMLVTSCAVTGDLPPGPVNRGILASSLLQATS